MSRFYGGGALKKPQKPEGPPNAKVGLNFLGGEMSPRGEPSDSVIRFVMKSGASIELRKDSVEEVVGTIADKYCKAICGLKGDGAKVFFENDRVDWIEEVTE